MKPFRLAALLATLSIFLAACSGSNSGQTPAPAPAPASQGGAQQAPPPKAKVVLFSQQQVQTVAFEMAREKGYFAAENLEVEFKYFASGTTALQTFSNGEGDIVYSGDVPAIRFWSDNPTAYQMIAPVERNAKGYQLVTKAEIKSAADLKGKTIATREGSSGSHFMWAFLNKHGFKPGDVKVTNMDGQVAISALDRGDIDGFFLWAPFPGRAMEVSGKKVHVLTDASEVVKGYYTLLGARPDWLKKNPDVATRFLRAARKGQEYAAANRPEVQKYLKTKFDLDEKVSSALWDNEEYLLKMDAGFFNDLTGIATWLQQDGLIKQKLSWPSFAYPQGLQGIEAALVSGLPQ